MHLGAPVIGSADFVAAARFGDTMATDLVEIADLSAHPERLDSGGWWAVVGTFEGELTGYRFAAVTRDSPRQPAGRRGEPAGGGWRGPAASAWTSTMTAQEYRTAVRAIKDRIAAGLVYQVNLCRSLSAPLPPGADPWALAAILAAGNPAPQAGVLALAPEVFVVSASPELFLRRQGDLLSSAPIKGTAPDRNSFADKDFPENIMITDLVRNDLSQVARPGSVRVTELLGVHDHPGLAHLVSTVECRLAQWCGWGDILAATFPPGSVSGAPKHTALQAIRQLEAAPRGVYCGAFGWVDADRQRAELAVAIRTFVAPGDGTLRFGTGAGITWHSDPDAEWRETELKAARLLGLASSR